MDGEDIVAVIIRSICSETEMVNAVDDIVIEAAEVRKSVRVRVVHSLTNALVNSVPNSWKIQASYFSLAGQLDQGASRSLIGSKTSPPPPSLLSRSAR
jgi:hypothetical protein